jgi:hypothetical protein
MPVVLRSEGYRLFFYSNEGDPREPVHVHVMRSGAEAKLWLDPVVTIARSERFSANELRAIIRIVETHRETIRRAWHEHFGH